MAARNKKARHIPHFGFITSEDDLVLPLRSMGAALIFLKKFMPAKCCDGRMLSMVVNRDGQTRCTVCDGKYQDEQRGHATRPC